MKIHPLLQDRGAVVVIRTPVPDVVGWDDFRDAARHVLAAIGLELDGEKVVIKPNVTAGEHFMDPDSGIGTHPGFVEGLAEYLKGHGAKLPYVTVVEDPLSTDDNALRHWRGTGYELLPARVGVRLHSPRTYTCVKRRVPHPLAHAQLNVSRLATAPGTVLINVPKLKTHNLSITTLCMKNLMGLVNASGRHFCSQAWQELPEAVRTNQRPRQEWLDREMHERWQTGLARRLVDTAQVAQPALNIVEGIVGREGTGFQRGRNRSLGLAIVGVNMVAVDALASYIMGFDPQRLIYLRLATEAGLGLNDVGKLRIYVEQDGEIVPCTDLDALRVRPPFQVISNIVGEDPTLFAVENDKW